MAFSLFLSLLIMKGSNPSVLTFGCGSEAASETSEMILSAWGRLFSRNTILEPKADGSVHIPYSDQKPGMNHTSGNVFATLRLALSHISSDE